MSMEIPGGFGPKAINQVPESKPSLEGYEKMPVAKALSNTFTDAESEHLMAVSRARSLMELREGIDAFNGATTPKNASELGLSLDDMEVMNQPVAIGEIHDFPDDAQVVLNRTKEGKMSLRIIDRPIS